MHIEVSRQTLTEFLSSNAALDDLGIYPLYPQGVTHADGTHTKRTPWQEGWNACVFEGEERYAALEQWLDSLSAEVWDTVYPLLLAEKCQLMHRDGTTCLVVNCNKLFYWASADREDLPLDELPAFLQALTDSPAYGDLLWACRKRGMRPQQPYYNHFTEAEKALFNAAGPERTDA